LIKNTIQVYFASVLGMEHEGMVSMFEALLESGLSGFLGCSSAIYEAALVDFFQNASVRDGMVVSTVQGKPITISEELFSCTFELPLEGLTDLHEVPHDLVSEARRAFSYDGKQLSTSFVKRKRKTGKATPTTTSLALVPVAQAAITILMISAVTHPAPKRKEPKRRLQLPEGSDDEIVDIEPAVESVLEQQRDKTNADEVDQIIGQIICETAQMETDMEEPSLTRSDDIIVEITKCWIAVNDEDD
ncbi:peroxisome biogenesis protein 22-like, partial [Dorcoceras hygrometricum]